jgi:hypothetical protein
MDPAPTRAKAAAPVTTVTKAPETTSVLRRPDQRRDRSARETSTSEPGRPLNEWGGCRSRMRRSRPAEIRDRSPGCAQETAKMRP